MLYAIRFYKSKLNDTSLKEGIVWGNYKDISIDKVEETNEENLIKISKNVTRDGIGNLQNNDCPNNILVLYELETLSDRKLMNGLINNRDLGKESNDESEISKKPFLGITMITLRKKAGQTLSQSINNFLDGIKNIKGKVNVSVSCYGTLEVYDVCVLSFAENIQGVMDFICDMPKTNVISSFSILTYTQAINEKEIKSKMKDETKSENYIANIQITCESTMELKKISAAVLSELKIPDSDKKTIKCYYSIGEYDICLHIPLQLINLNGYAKLCSLDTSSPIKQISTRFSKEIPIEIDNEKDFTKTDGKELTKGNRVINEKLLNCIKNLLVDNENKKTLDFVSHILCVDYMRFSQMRDSVIPNVLVEDLEYQFISIMNRINEMNKLKREEEPYSIFMQETLTSLANLFSRSLYNVIQSQSFDIEETYSYFRNSGVFYKIFMAYNTFVKDLILLIYMNAGHLQSEIVPVISFDSVNVPKSHPYLNGNTYSSDCLENEPISDPPRVIEIQLPFDAIVRMNVYLPLLAHEIAHYISPIDRRLRNKYLLLIAIKQCFIKIFKDLGNDYTKIKTERDTYVIGNMVNEYFNNNFEELTRCIQINYNLTNEMFIREVLAILKCFLDEDIPEENKEGISISNSQYLTITFKRILEIIYKEKIKNKSFELNKIIAFVKTPQRRKTYISVSNSILRAAKEAFCDIWMMETFCLSLCGYYALMLETIKAQKLMGEKGIEFNARVGFVSYFSSQKFLSPWLDNKKRKNLLKNFPLDLSDDDKKCIQSILLRVNSKISDEEFCKGISIIRESIEYIGNDGKYFYEDLCNLIQCYGLEHTKINIEKVRDYSCIDTAIINFGTTIEEIQKIYNDEIGRDPVNSTNEKSISLELINNLENIISIKDISLFYKDEKERNKDIPIFKSLKSSLFPCTVSQIPVTDIVLVKSNLEGTISQAQKIIAGDKAPYGKIWYRGQQDANWRLIPSIYRSNDPKINSFQRLLQCYELFRAQACCSGEIQSAINSTADWIACMQHYFVPTHFLDWAEQPFPALYFISEHYFDSVCKFDSISAIPNCSTAQGSYLKSDAALYVLNPLTMNQQLHNINIVPNLALPINEKNYADYVIPQMRSNGKYFCSDRDDTTPLAVITSQLTSRINAQKGHFTAYNIRLSPSELSNMKDLYEIQDQMLRGNSGAKPFISKIIIPYEDRESIAEMLKTYNINKSTYYPELMNIGSEVSKWQW